MRVLFAPDKFAGTLSAVEAAAAMAAGWARRVARTTSWCRCRCRTAVPGSSTCCTTALGGDLHAVTVSGPYGDPTPAAVLRVGETAYVESAQAVGLHLTAPEDRRPGAGDDPRAGRGARRTPSTRTSPGSSSGSAGPPPTTPGPDCSRRSVPPPRAARSTRARPGSRTSAAVSVEAARARFDGVELVLASDVDNPLLGINGATKIYGPQKGLPEERLVTVDGWLQRFAELTDRKLAAQKGAGAAGGLGFALMLLGGTRASGVALVSEAVGLVGAIARRRPGGHRGGGLRLLLAAPARCRTAWRRSRPSTWCPASRSPGRC